MPYVAGGKAVRCIMCGSDDIMELEDSIPPCGSYTLHQYACLRCHFAMGFTEPLRNLTAEECAFEGVDV